MNPRNIAVILLISLHVACSTTSSPGSDTRNKRPKFNSPSVSERQATSDILQSLDSAAQLPVRNKSDLFSASNVVLAVDTSRSMRDFETHKIRIEAIDRMRKFITRMSNLEKLFVIDGDGRPICTWKMNEEDDAGVQSDVLVELLKIVRENPTESQSRPTKVFRHASVIKKEAFEGAPTKLFIFGDEFAVEPDEFLEIFERWYSSEGTQPMPVVLISSHQEWGSLRKPDMDTIRNTKGHLRSYEKYELYGRYIAYRTNGAYYDFEESDLDKIKANQSVHTTPASAPR